MYYWSNFIQSFSMQERMQKLELLQIIKEYILISKNKFLKIENIKERIKEKMAECEKEINDMHRRFLSEEEMKLFVPSRTLSIRTLELCQIKIMVEDLVWFDINVWKSEMSAMWKEKVEVFRFFVYC